MSAFDLDAVNRRHGTAFRSFGRYVGGEFGAVRLVDGAGRRFVLKRQEAGAAPTTTDALRAVGYPCPRYIAWGADYHIQEELPGRPAGDWGAPAELVIARLLELNELQAGRAVDDDRGWPAAIVESVRHGFQDYAVVGTLESHSAESRELLSVCRCIVEQFADGIPPAADVVHWDFTLSNVLVEGERLTGVIDWSDTRSGDRLFDLATLVYYSRGEMGGVERYVVERIGEGGLLAYLAHLAVRQSDWSIRHHGGAGDEVVRYSLELMRR